MSNAYGVTVSELAEMLGLDVNQVRGLVDRGTIASLNFGHGTKRFIPYRELDRLRERGFRIRRVQSEHD